MRTTLSWGVLVCLMSSSVASAVVMIGDDDIYEITTNEQGSGNGNLDLVLFTAETAQNKRNNPDFDGDDANTSLPNGGGTSAEGSYITSMNELRAFYILNFPVVGNPNASTVNQIALFVDVNELGSINDISLDGLKIVIDYNQLGNVNDPRNNPGANDIGSSSQNSTGASFTGGTTLAQLDASPKVLPLNNQGGGWADQVIFTGINPFDSAYNSNPRVLFYWKSSDHDNGGESVFLSGEVSAQDILDTVPEPAGVMALLVMGLGVLPRWRRVHRGPASWPADLPAM